MTVLATKTEPLQVWIGCCHEWAERMVGCWYDADEAGLVTVERLHADAGVPLKPGCEELWCYDHSGFPSGTGEMSPAAAQEWGDAYNECEPHLWPALTAWIETGAYVAQGNGDIPVVSDFIDAYQGEYDDVEDYARAYVDETGMMEGWSETAMTYFDWERWSSDLETELTTADAPGSGIYVFANP
ncbi:MAG: antirestriction protein ArdA [Actinomyces urogenitalis]|uniref:antirestriction protein ArdA n=1 Tax=Actinomyces urogenitalis TaxID=103621 RepID=UPI002A823F0B|nr:antirestriction protein ArdA [Actinomyces urogenitalis]MDY3678040.1 antirestriction protein ArdA [Actinomyces urogenitalis]